MLATRVARRIALLSLGLLILPVMADLAWSQNANSLSVDEMVQQLKGDGSTSVGDEPTRALRPGAASKSTTLPATPGEAKPAAGGTLSLQVQFDFASDQLSQSSYGVLQKLAKALASGSLENYTFDVVGHTDAVGSAEYNLALSKRRASSVKAYLVDQGVQSGRIRANGKGFSELLDPASPKSSVNRRVEVTANPG